MDVLTHALEAYVSTKANDYSDAMAEKVIQLVFTYLERAYKDGNDLEAREKCIMRLVLQEWLLTLLRLA